MYRFTKLDGDGYYVVTNENCFEDSCENYCGPAIDKLAEYENKLEKKEKQSYCSPITNEQKIKMMRTEEFVDWLMDLVDWNQVGCWECSAQKYCNSDDMSGNRCRDAMIGWMKQECMENQYNNTEKYTSHINDVQLKMSDFWIDVNKELPEEHKEVLCYWWNGVIQPCRFEYDSSHKPMWCSPLTGTVGVLYWMPFPKAPGKEKD